MGFSNIKKSCTTWFLILRDKHTTHMDTSVYASLFIIILFSTILYVLWRSQSRIEEYIVVNESTRFNSYVRKIASPQKFWNPLGYVSVGIMSGIVFSASLFILWLLGTLINIVVINSTLSFDPNIFGSRTIFIIIAVIALAIGIIIHELGHGVYIALEDKEFVIGMKSIALLIPIIAYVKQDETKTSVFSALKITSGGVLFNLLSIILVSILLFGVVIPAIAPVDGAGVSNVQEHGAFDDANIEQGDVITSVNGNTVSSYTDARNELRGATESRVTVTLDSGETKEVERKLTVQRSALETISVSHGDEITHVNNERVYSLNHIPSVVGDDTHASLRTDSGYEADIPIGVMIEYSGEKMVVTHVDGERVHTERNVQQLQSQISDRDVSVSGVTITDDEHVETTISGDKLLNNAIGDMSGISFAEYGVSFYPSDTYLGILSSTSTASMFVEESNLIPPWLTSLPGFGFIALIIALPMMLYPPNNTLPYGFVGFSGGVENFYTATGVFAFMGDGLLFIATLMIMFILTSILIIIVNSIPMTQSDGWKIMYYYMYVFTRVLRKYEFVDEITDYQYSRTDNDNGDVYIPSTDESITLTKVVGKDGILAETEDQLFDPYAYNIMLSVGQIFTYTMIVIAFWLII